MFTITIDNATSSQPFTQYVGSSNQSTPQPGRIDLYNSTQMNYQGATPGFLTDGPHTVSITNRGPGLLLDSVVVGSRLGADG